MDALNDKSSSTPVAVSGINLGLIRDSCFPMDS